VSIDGSIDDAHSTAPEDVDDVILADAFQLRRRLVVGGVHFSLCLSRVLARAYHEMPARGVESSRGDACSRFDIELVVQKLLCMAAFG